MTQLRISLLFLAALTSAGAFAQNTYQLFGPVDTRLSSNATATPFGTSILNLSCPTSVPITAVVSSSTTPVSTSPTVYANVFTDNYIGLSVNGSSQFNNICTGGYENSNCFNTAYTSAYPGLNGDDPDTFVATYGVPALDISGDIPTGKSQIAFQLLDSGVSLGASSVFLITNCTQNGTSPGGSITANTITSTTPVQGFPFDSTNGQRVEFSADYTAIAGQLTGNTIPTVTNGGVLPTAWSAIVKGTSFATTTCVPDLGNLDASGNPLCTLSTILCTNGTNAPPAGDLCPQSTTKNIQMFHTFDATTASVTKFPPGSGLGFLMGSDTWPATSCIFEGPETGKMCPQNPLTSFLGDYRSGSGGATTNSTFVAVAGVPLPLTLAGFLPNRFGWSNSETISLGFLTVPPFVLPPNNGFIAAAIQTLTYGIDSPAPYPDTSLPIPGDVTLPKTNPVTCPGAPTAGALPLLTSDTVTNLAEGTHVLHYFATDCAGTEELVFTPNVQNKGNWASFKTLTIKVDVTKPFVATGPTLTPAGPYVLHQGGVVAKYSCSDPEGSLGAAPSGVVLCGPPTHLVPAAPNTGPLTSAVNTSVVGPQSFTVNVQDLAGNVGPSMSATYNVNFNFTGFLSPVQNPPATNAETAGSTVALQFGLGGSQGLAVFAAGYPISQPCGGGTPNSENKTGLTYSGSLYTYKWKTNAAWVGTCRQLVIELTDGTTHAANFQF